MQGPRADINVIIPTRTVTNASVFVCFESDAFSRRAWHFTGRILNLIAISKIKNAFSDFEFWTLNLDGSHAQYAPWTPSKKSLQRIGAVLEKVCADT